MPSFGRTFGNVASGASSGFSIAGPWGAAVGGAAGLVAGLLDDDPYAARQAQIEKYRTTLKEDRDRELNEAVRRIATRSRGLQSVAGAAGARRALSLGRESDVESFAQPAQAQIANQTSAIREDAIAGINTRYADALRQLDMGEIMGPVEPSDSEYFTTVAGNIGEFANAYKQADALSNLVNADATDTLLRRRSLSSSFSMPKPNLQQNRNDIINTLRLRESRR